MGKITKRGIYLLFALSLNSLVKADISGLITIPGGSVGESQYNGNYFFEGSSYVVYSTSTGRLVILTPPTAFSLTSFASYCSSATHVGRLAVSSGSTSGQWVYICESSGNWVQQGGSGSGSPGGSTTHVQYNDGGSFGGDSGLTYDKNAYALKIGTNTSTKNIFVEDAAGDLWILANASYSVTTGKFFRIDTSKVAWGIEMIGRGVFPGEVDSGWVVWRATGATAGQAEIFPTFGTVGGWELGYDVTSNRDLVVGGGAIELDGFGTFPYGRFIHSNLSGTSLTGVGRNLYNDLADHDSDIYPDVFVGFSSDTFIVAHSTPQALTNLRNLLVVSTGVPSLVNLGGMAIKSIYWSDGTIQVSSPTNAITSISTNTSGASSFIWNQSTLQTPVGAGFNVSSGAISGSDGAHHLDFVSDSLVHTGSNQIRIYQDVFGSKTLKGTFGQRLASGDPFIFSDGSSNQAAAIFTTNSKASQFNYGLDITNTGYFGFKPRGFSSDITISYGGGYFYRSTSLTVPVTVTLPQIGQLTSPQIESASFLVCKNDTSTNTISFAASSGDSVVSGAALSSIGECVLFVSSVTAGTDTGTWYHSMRGLPTPGSVGYAVISNSLGSYSIGLSSAASNTTQNNFPMGDANGSLQPSSLNYLASYPIFVGSVVYGDNILAIGDMGGLTASLINGALNAKMSFGVGSGFTTSYRANVPDTPPGAYQAWTSTGPTGNQFQFQNTTVIVSTSGLQPGASFYVSSGTVVNVAVTTITFNDASKLATAPEKEYWWPASATLPLEASNDSIAPVVLTTATAFDLITTDFDSATDECRSVNFLVSTNTLIGVSTVTFSAYWMSASATTGNVGFYLYHNNGAQDGEGFNSSSPQTHSSTFDAVKSTTDRYTVTSWDVSVSSLTWRGGDLVDGKFCRDADNASDTMSGDAKVAGFGIRFKRL